MLVFNFVNESTTICTFFFLLSSFSSFLYCSFDKQREGNSFLSFWNQQYYGITLLCTFSVVLQMCLMSTTSFNRWMAMLKLLKICHQRLHQENLLEWTQVNGKAGKANLITLKVFFLLYSNIITFQSHQQWAKEGTGTISYFGIVVTLIWLGDNCCIDFKGSKQSDHIRLYPIAVLPEQM